MRWLFDNYKWLFDGVGGTVVIGLIGLWYRHWRKRQREDQAPSSTLTAQGAKVENSPVASGSGITQTINSPTINLSLPNTSAPSTPLQFFNVDGSKGPLKVSGRQHSVQDPSLVDLWCLVTIVNYTHYPMKIEPRQLVLNGVEWPPHRMFFRPASDPRPRYERISVVGNHKEDYQLHFMFPAANCPKAISGFLAVSSSTRKSKNLAI
jgi:hypothetical protein